MMSSTIPAVPSDPATDAFVRHLIACHQQRTTLPATVPVPTFTDAAVADAIQQQIIAALGVDVAGWKVGAKTPAGPITGAPLPAPGVVPSGATLQRGDYHPGGLELEIAFRCNRRFDARSTPYSADEVHAGIGVMLTTIEVVSSRYANWPNVEPMATQADLGTHGALVVGEAVPYREDFPYLSPVASFTLTGADGTVDLLAGTQGKVGNAAGDPRRLLPWLVNHCTVDLGIAITPAWTLTCGSYSGLFVPTHGGTVRGEFAGLPPVSFTLR